MHFQILFDVSDFYRKKVETMRSRTKIMLTVAVILVVALSAVGALMAFNKSPDLLDSEFRVIVTGSMDGEPQTQYKDTNFDIETIPVNSLIAVHKLSGDSSDYVKEGDVIGFYSEALGGNIYHRVIEIDESKGRYVTHGDANAPGVNELVPFEKANGIVVNVNHTAGQGISFVQGHLLYLVIMVVLFFVMVEALLTLIKIWKE